MQRLIVPGLINDSPNSSGIPVTGLLFRPATADYDDAPTSWAIHATDQAAGT
jgi:hypothetical protein